MLWGESIRKAEPGAAGAAGAAGAGSRALCATQLFLFLETPYEPCAESQGSENPCAKQVCSQSSKGRGHCELMSWP